MYKHTSADLKILYTGPLYSLRTIDSSAKRHQEVHTTVHWRPTISKSLAPFMTADDPEVTELFQRLKYYQEELKRAECEYGTLPTCTTSGCTVHGTPPSSPSKSLKDYPALPKPNSNKRKESDDGFISPTRRQTIKKPNLITNNSFSLETGNTFDKLKEKDITGTSTSQATTQNDNTPTNTNQIKKFLPPTNNVILHRHDQKHNENN
ncbi:hypothetical protein TNIN_382051 [Trichonephila inaurata madagascariensis]|uniref:Uncharacterized protein n=1 Tax=Trichonephila inaurata madagascariensis TaxID=2747483 RepID=A0A8X6IHK4_9ARAC|nr:hypothetical protein TNIN_382051 [Trichonephila inaurata madagascariensis]